MSIAAQRVRKNEAAGKAAAETVERATPLVDGAAHGFLPVPVAAVGGAPLRRLATGDDPLGGTAVDAPVVAALRRRRGRGARLPENVAGPWSDHFGADMSTVRVHDDAEAGRLARSVQATAFTYGDDIYVGPGVRPNSGDGLRVLAHEAGHVAAQRRGADRGAGGPLTVGRADDPAEAAADRAADAALGALRRSTAAPAASGTGHRTTHAVPAALRRSTKEPSTLQRLPLPKWMKFGKGGGAAQETRSVNPLHGIALPRPATPKDPDRRAGTKEVEEADGRRANLQRGQNPPQHVIKITTAGSAYGKWATNEAADVADGYAPDGGKKGLLGGVKSKDDLEQAWKREGVPNPGQWDKMEDPSPSRPVWYQ